jgi:hypothetical protein
VANHCHKQVANLSLNQVVNLSLKQVDNHSPNQVAAHYQVVYQLHSAEDDSRADFHHLTYKLYYLITFNKFLILSELNLISQFLRDLE